MKSLKIDLVLYFIPILLSILDLLIRSSQMKRWSIEAWGIYLVSLIFTIGIWQIIFFITYFLKFHFNRYFIIVIFIFSFIIMFIYLASWGFYFYFKFSPNYYIVDYIFTELEHFWVIFKKNLLLFLPIWFTISLTVSLLLWTLTGEFIKEVMTKKFLLIIESIFWVTAFFVLNNNLRIYDQSSLPDTNFFVIICQYFYNKLTHSQIGTSSLKPRIIPKLEHINREPEFNILIMLQESLRPDHLSIYGYERNTTPNLKKFFGRHKEEIFLFERAQAQSNTTHLSVICILQGLNPSISGKFWHTSPTLFEYAKCLSNVSTFFITSQRFHWQNWDIFIKSPALDYVWSQETSGLPFFNDTGVDDREMVKAFIRHISKIVETDQKFFGLIGFNVTHWSYNAPKEYQKWGAKNTIDKYDGCILLLDSAINTVLTHLEKTELINNTIVFFISDHAEAFGEHNYWGHSRFYFENIWVPFWIFIPKSLHKKIAGLKNLRENTKKVVAQQDITPTILDLYGLYGLKSISEYQEIMQGESLLKRINESRPIFSLSKTDIARLSITTGLSLIINGKKYLIDSANNVVQEYLFDIYNDPRETKNLWPSLKKEEKDFYRQKVQSYPNTRTIYKETVKRFIEKSQPEKRLKFD